MNDVYIDRRELVAPRGNSSKVLSVVFMRKNSTKIFLNILTLVLRPPNLEIRSSHHAKTSRFSLRILCCRSFCRERRSVLVES